MSQENLRRLGAWVVTAPICKAVGFSPAVTYYHRKEKGVDCSSNSIVEICLAEGGRSWCQGN